MAMSLVLPMTAKGYDNQGGARVDGRSGASLLLLVELPRTMFARFGLGFMMGAGSDEVVDWWLRSFNVLVTMFGLVALLSKFDEGDGVGFGERGSFCQDD